MTDLVLPAFELDCREWLVSSPEESGDPDDAPTLAVFSTLLIDDDMREAHGTLTVGLLDLDEMLLLRTLAPGCITQQLIDEDVEPGLRRYLMRVPGQQLALVAEFSVPVGYPELERRVEHLMRSFRWQGAL